MKKKIRKIEEIVIIYDKSNQGKTSTLRSLIDILVGSLPNVKGDFRAIIQGYHTKGQHKKINIFIATCGDAPEIIEDNIRFFNGKMPDGTQYPTYLFTYGTNGVWINIDNVEQINNIETNLCISACRSDGIGVDAMQYFMQSKLAYTFTSVWIRLSLLRQKLNVRITKRKTPDWRKVANELKEMIDQKFARRIIQ